LEARRKQILETLEFGEATEGDVDRTLQLFGIGVDDVGKNPTPGALPPTSLAKPIHPNLRLMPMSMAGALT
jgi:hypothetical protein